MNATQPKSFPELSLIIPNFNGAGLLRENLPHVLEAMNRYPGSAVLIVVDDGSRDESLKVLSGDFPEARVVVHPENLGFSEAILSGVKTAETEVCVLLNSDVQPEADFLTPLVEHLADPEIFSVQSAIRVEGPQTHPFCLSRFVFRRGALKRVATPDLGNRPWLCLYASGGSMAVKRSLFLEFGGFLPILKPFYWEDFDLGLRAWRRGFRSCLEPRSRVLHQEKGSIRDHVRKQKIRFALRRNKLIAEWIHFPLSSLLLLWIPRTLGRLFLRLCVGDLDYLRALLSAASRWREILEIRTRLEETSRLDFLQVIDLLESENRAHDKTLFQKPEGGTSV